jgi:plastocyanin
MGWTRLLLAGVAVLAFGAASAKANTATVEVGQTGDSFTNANVTINPGDTVHWHWDSTFHSVTSGQPPGTADGAFDSGVKQSLPATFDETFSHPGVYHYFCQIHYALGMVGTITVTGTDTAPTAAFSFSPNSPVRGQPVHFDASGSATSDTDVFDTYQWNFGDGSPVQTTNLPTTDHTFASAGSHMVKLTVTDSGSATASVTHQLAVALPPDATPVARFSVSPAKPPVGAVVTFNGSASSDSDGDAIKSYRWTFGDGASQVSTSPTITHRYTRPGTVTAQLSVVDERGTASTPLTRALRIAAAVP